MRRRRAAVVGSGPNGLAAAIELTLAEYDVQLFEAADTFGGGARSTRVSGVDAVVDDCSAAHPPAMASPFFQSLPERGVDLAEFGVSFIQPQIPFSHALAPGRSVHVFRSVEETARGMGPDEEAWRRVFAPLVRNRETLANAVLKPLSRIRPTEIMSLPNFFATGGLPAASATKLLWRGNAARSAILGAAAHAMCSLHGPGTYGLGVFLTSLAHSYGWPVVEGGTGQLTKAMVDWLASQGTVLRASHRIRSLRELERESGVDRTVGDLVFLDTSPVGALGILRDQPVPWRVRRVYRGYRHSRGAFRVDFFLREPVPWADASLAPSGIIHLGGTPAETIAAEKGGPNAEFPAAPFILVGQQYMADPSRKGAGGILPLWTYAHVPRGFRDDATATIADRLEQFAPGFSEHIISTRARGPHDLHAENENYLGGDIGGGLNSIRQIVARPRLLRPYETGVRGVYLCSASTAPGGGTHGMGGANAVRTALQDAAKA